MSSVLYSSARAVSMEKNLLGDDRLKRMIDGTGFDALKILSEVGFAFGGNASDEIDNAIDDETAKLSAFIKETAPDDKLVKFFLYPYDFRNAEALVKSKYLKTDAVHFSGGSIDVNTLKEKIFTDNYDGLPHFMGVALLNADKAFVEGKYSGQSINVSFTKSLYDELFSLNVKDARIDKILMAKADMLNVSVALRTRDFISAEKQFVHFGDLKKDSLKSVCEDDFDKIREKFRFSDYKELIFAALDGIEAKTGLKEFERLCDGYAVKVIKKYRYDSDGALPFIRYCFYKLADIANARIILVGHSANLTGAEISERIREHYEG